jgi:hypothetical protein
LAFGENGRYLLDPFHSSPSGCHGALDSGQAPLPMSWSTLRHKINYLLCQKFSCCRQFLFPLVWRATLFLLSYKQH